MIRHLHPTDSPGLLRFGQSAGKSEVCNLTSALQGGPAKFSTVKYAGIALSPRAWQNCWVEAHRARIHSLVRAGTRSGPQAWEITELYTRRSNPGMALDLFEQISVPAGGAGAHRIFTRTVANSDTAEYARQAGYRSAYMEAVFRAPSSQSAFEKLGIPDHALSLRQFHESDIPSLFRMYNEVTPLDVRMKLGQTSQEWYAGIEKLGRGTKQWVLELPDRNISALVRRHSSRAQHTFDIQWSSIAGSELHGLVAAALAESGNLPVSVAVPEFNPALSHLLVTLGFQQIGEYEVMVKPLAQAVEETKGAFAAIG